MKYSMLLTLLLVGCAMTPQQAAEKSDYELCEIALTGKRDSANAAWAELDTRNRSCDRWRADILNRYQASQARNAAIGQAGMQILYMQEQRRSYATPPPRNCVYDQFQGMLIQHCN